jgi:hypothetical protein
MLADSSSADVRPWDRGTPHCQLSRKLASRAVSRQELRGATLLFGQLRHCTPVRLSRVGCSVQFGRASAPTIPQRVHTMRGPKAGTATSSGQRSALSTA